MVTYPVEDGDDEWFIAIHRDIELMQTASIEALQKLVDLAEGPQQIKFDMLIAPGNKQGVDLLTRSIGTLVEQTRYIEQVAATLKVDALNPDTADHEF